MQAGSFSAEMTPARRGLSLAMQTRMKERPALRASGRRGSLIMGRRSPICMSGAPGGERRMWLCAASRVMGEETRVGTAFSHFSVVFFCLFIRFFLVREREGFIDRLVLV